MDDRPEHIILSPCTTSKTIEMRIRAKIDLEKAEKELSPDHDVLANTSIFISFEHKEKQFTLYKSGKIIIKETDSGEGKPLLLEVFELLKERGCLLED
ncbi:hypothetical protein GF415_04785 [Candidatus Micrarchaeota archaeon]|nr:hypothetical protein [Candidatus Micrarchaeota archaeon]